MSHNDVIVRSAHLDPSLALYMNSVHKYFIYLYVARTLLLKLIIVEAVWPRETRNRDQKPDDHLEWLVQI